MKNGGEPSQTTAAMARGSKNKNKKGKSVVDHSKLALASLIATDGLDKIPLKQRGSKAKTEKPIDVSKFSTTKNKPHTIETVKDRHPDTAASRRVEKPSLQNKSKKTQLVNLLDKLTKPSEPTRVAAASKQPDEESKTVQKVHNHGDGSFNNKAPRNKSSSTLVKKPANVKKQKPSLIELKTYVAQNIEMIQDYDVDSRQPYTNASLKTSKNVVGIPCNWKEKKGYLTSRSLMDKPNFELPDIFVQTGIQELREINTGNNDDKSTLKEDSRAKVQPKLNTLDLDYRKLYDVMFKIGANWKPDFMLPFGDLYYENRELNNNNVLKHLEGKFRPGKLSDKLLQALGYELNGRIPVWCVVSTTKPNTPVATKDKKSKRDKTNKNNTSNSLEVEKYENKFNNHYNLEIMNKIDKDGVYAQLIRKRKRKNNNNNQRAGRGKGGGATNNGIELFGAKINTQLTIDELSADVDADLPLEETVETETITAVENRKGSDASLLEQVSAVDDKKTERAASEQRHLYKVIEQKRAAEGKLMYNITDSNEKSGNSSAKKTPQTTNSGNDNTVIEIPTAESDTFKF